MIKLVGFLQLSFRNLHHILTFQPANDVSIWALVSSKYQPGYVQQQRAGVLRVRITLISALFSILAILWSVVDYLAFPHELFMKLFFARWIVGCLFMVIAIVSVNTQRTFALVSMIACMLTILTAFYFLCRPVENPMYSLLGEIAFSSYSLMPFVLFAGLGFFPITLVESVILTLPLLAAFAVAALKEIFLHSHILNFGSIWIMTLLGGISTLTSLSQLRLLIRQISLSAYDTLTDCLNRKYGEQAIQLTWNLGKRYDRHYAIAYLDLDNFKSVNDTFGHQHGDDVLSNTAMHIKKMLRGSDFIIRWGGEEFLLILPDTDAAGATEVIKRLYDKGFGIRPDGSPQTVSIGMAERMADKAADWRDLVRMADKRLYLAKTSGKNRHIGPDQQENRPLLN